MKKALPLLCVCCLLISNSYAQTSKRYLYLVVDIKEQYDKVKEKGYYAIFPEDGDPNAAFIDSLISFSAKLKNRQPESVYRPKADTTHRLLNYFKNISEALQFLDEQGWQLFTINNTVYGDGGNSRVSTEAKYFLRRERNE
jgi:hypothetical protein